MTLTRRWASDALAYDFRDPALLEQALTHRSAATAHYERLEFLGDAVLGLVVAEILYGRYPDADEGLLSRLRARLVRRTTMESLARELGLGNELRLGGGELRAGGHQRGSILANAMEALLGAVFLDGGFEEARRVIIRLLETRVADLTGGDELRDPKTRLQEWLQARGLPLPTYELARVSGSPHARRFEVRCLVDPPGIQVEGHGTSRRGAEQEAAGAALTALNADG